MRRPLVLILLASLSAAATSPIPSALAQPAASVEERGRLADEHFKRGKALLLVAGKEKEAYEEYVAAWNLKQVYDIAGNLGNVELSLNKPRDAAEHLAFALHNHAASATSDQLAVLARKLDAAKKQVATLTIQVSADGARVLVDGKDVGRSPLADEIYLEPGDHAVTAALAGQGEARRLVEAHAGSSETLSLTLEAIPPPVASVSAAPVASPPPASQDSEPPRQAPSASASPTPPRSNRPPERPLWPIAVGVPATVVFLTAGIVLTAMTNAKRGEIATAQATVDASGRRCGAGVDPSVCTDLDSAVSSRNHLRSAAVAGFVGAGVAALATPILFFWVTPREGSARKESHVAPMVGVESGGASVGVRGAF